VSGGDFLDVSCAPPASAAAPSAGYDDSPEALLWSLPMVEDEAVL
jgi:hypothetical protein